MSRIAILETDTPLPEVQALYGPGYGDVFKLLLNNAAAALKIPTPIYTVYHVVNQPGEYPDPAKIDAILITGSRHNSYEDVDWISKLCAHCKLVYEEYPHVKLIGICFGHQILARALGGATAPNTEKGWELAVTEVNLTEKGAKIIPNLPQKLRLPQMHRDIVTALPKGVEVIGSNDNCKYQALYIPDRMLSVQGHPEFNQKILEIILDSRHQQKILTDDVYSEAYRRTSYPHDGDIVAEAILRFIMS